MQNQLELSQYLEWYVLSDPGTVFLRVGSVTGQPQIWFHPKYGLDAGSELCIGAGPADELEKFKIKLDKKRTEFRSTDAHKAYVKIETAIQQVVGDKGKLSELDTLKSFQSDSQKERIARLRKR